MTDKTRLEIVSMLLLYRLLPILSGVWLPLLGSSGNKRFFPDFICKGRLKTENQVSDGLMFT